MKKLKDLVLFKGFKGFKGRQKNVSQDVSNTGNLEMVEAKRKETLTVEGLIAKAIENNVNIETMEKLLAMRKELKAEIAREKFYNSLSLFQKEVPIIKKTSQVFFTNRNRQEVAYSYAKLDEIIAQIKDCLQKYGFSFTIKTLQTETAFTAVCIIHHIGGHSEETTFTVPLSVSDYMNAAQKVGAASTYAKRYALLNALGIVTADEDTDALIETGNIKDSKDSKDSKEFKKNQDSKQDINIKDFSNEAGKGIDKLKNLNEIIAINDIEQMRQEVSILYKTLKREKRLNEKEADEFIGYALKNKDNLQGLKALYSNYLLFKK